MQQSFFAESAAYERFMGRWSRQSPHCWFSLPTYATGRRSSTSAQARGVGAGCRSVAPSAQITGVDPSASYVAHAQGARPQSAFGSSWATRIADARRDLRRVVTLFVMNFIPDRPEGTSGTSPAPTASIAAAVWDYGDGMQMLRVFWDEAVA